MKILILETSTEKSCLVLSENENPIAAKLLLGGPDLSKNLALEVNKLLGSTTPDLIAIGIGPGSYTGIRVGTALAKTLSYGWKIPLMGFCSLKAFTPKLSSPFITLVDARMGGFYALIDDKPLLISPDDARLQITPHIASPHPELIKKRLTTKAFWHETNPDPTLLANLCFSQFLEEGISPIELTYLSCP